MMKCPVKANKPQWCAAIVSVSLILYLEKLLSVKDADGIKRKRHGTLHYPIRGTGIPYMQIREPTPRS
ncbi:hypothetical protein C3729_12830 [Cloacibacterium normanense]|uniref:Uncharacterized protein n=1 Tax=Cloacibacterium normanense TaxID=237258 RepID=A0A2S7I1P4_9FLAO|nr:hypothetical protein C3729_12830 [Cloacibacterium normanense]